MKWITVVKLGADGGSLRLLGLKKRNRDWSFLLSSDESTMDGLLSEEDAEGMIGPVILYKKIINRKNGAGKSTILNILTGLTKRTGGMAEILGSDV